MAIARIFDPVVVLTCIVCSSLLLLGCGDDDDSDGSPRDASQDGDASGGNDRSTDGSGHDCDTTCYLGYLDGNIACEGQYQTCVSDCAGDSTCIRNCTNPKTTCVIGVFGTYYACAQSCNACIKAYYDDAAQCEDEYPEGAMREGCMDGALSDMVDCLQWDAVCFTTGESQYNSCLAGCGGETLCLSNCLETWYEWQKDCLGE